MSPPEGRLTVDGMPGSVILPGMLEDPLVCTELVGRILGRAIEAGGTVTLDDIRENRGLSYVPFYEYLERPGAIERIVDLDRRTFEEMGHDFSDRPWTAENFRMELPGKADVSFVADGEGEFIGFFVASERIPGEAHGHRIVMEPKWKTGRMALQLWCAYWRVAAAQPRIRLLTGEVGTDNRTMRRFLELLGFQPLDEEETREYLASRDRDEPLDGVEIIGEDGARSIAMTLRIR